MHGPVHFVHVRDLFLLSFDRLRPDHGKSDGDVLLSLIISVLLVRPSALPLGNETVLAIKRIQRKDLVSCGALRLHVLSALLVSRLILGLFLRSVKVDRRFSRFRC